MTELEKLLWEIESHGNSITTFDLQKTGIMQYQRALKQLREKLAEKGIRLTNALPIIGQRRNFLYKIIREPKQLDLPMRAA